jgi:hypothetical protein
MLRPADRQRECRQLIRSVGVEKPVFPSPPDREVAHPGDGTHKGNGVLGPDPPREEGEGDVDEREADPICPKTDSFFRIHAGLEVEVAGLLVVAEVARDEGVDVVDAVDGLMRAEDGGVAGGDLAEGLAEMGSLIWATSPGSAAAEGVWGAGGLRGTLRVSNTRVFKMYVGREVSSDFPGGKGRAGMFLSQRTAQKPGPLGPG